MTERLSALMAAEADRLDVPAPPAAAVLARGRGLRRRRRGIQLGAGLASVALVAGLAAGFVPGDDPGDGAVDPSAPSTAVPDLGAVFAVGPRVHLTGPDVVAEVDDVTVKSMYYTSAGVLVRHGENNYSDGGGPQRFSLVTPEGEVRPIDVVTDEVVPGVDSSQALLAYAEVVDGTVEVVVHDLVADEEVARVPVPDARRWGGWSAPPVSLTGDEVYVGTDDVARVVDWRTGQVREEPSVPTGFPPQFFGGRTVIETDSEARVVDAAGTTLLSAERSRRSYTTYELSPDGRFAKLVDEVGFPPPDDVSFDVFDVETGSSVTFDGESYGWRWTSDAQLFTVDGSGVLTTCSPSTGACTEEEQDLEVLPDSRPGAEDFSDDLVLGNEVRES